MQGNIILSALAKTENETFIFKDTTMNNIREEKPPVITKDNRLTFSSHIRKLCKIFSQKITALSRISKQFSDSEKKNFLTLL